MADSLAINELKMSYSNQTSSSIPRVLPAGWKISETPICRSVTVSSLVGIVFGLLSQFVIAAEPADTEQPEAPRWFEIEVILFKLTSDAGLTNESWDKDVQLEMPQDLIDFLQPYEVAENMALQSQQEKQSEQNVINASQSQEKALPLDKLAESNSNNTSQIPQLSDTEALDQQPQGFEETPFQALDESTYQLNKEAQSIDKNSRYQLVAHIAWRQPVLSREQSQSVRLAGGIDYHDSFEYQGNKKIEETSIEQTPMEDDANLSPTDIDNQAAMLQQSKQYSETAEQSDQTVIENVSLTQALQTDPLATEQAAPIALPWVPEIDGSAKVYIQRNYLHFDTKLYYRRPDKEEVDIISLNSGKYLMQSGDYSVDTDLQSDQNVIDAVDFSGSNQPINTESADNNQQTISINSDFSWQFDDDFLNQDTEKVYTERLFNYPLIQTRRLRSGELHYFDHPLIGILVMIRPYKTETELQASELEATEE